MVQCFLMDYTNQGQRFRKSMFSPLVNTTNAQIMNSNKNKQPLEQPQQQHQHPFLESFAQATRASIEFLGISSFPFGRVKPQFSFSYKGKITSADGRPMISGCCISWIACSHGPFNSSHDRAVRAIPKATMANYPTTNEICVIDGPSCTSTVCIVLYGCGYPSRLVELSGSSSTHLLVGDGPARHAHTQVWVKSLYTQHPNSDDTVMLGRALTTLLQW